MMARILRFPDFHWTRLEHYGGHGHYRGHDHYGELGQYEGPSGASFDQSRFELCLRREERRNL